MARPETGRGDAGGYAAGNLRCSTKTNARPKSRAPTQSGLLRPSLGRLAVPAEPVDFARLRRQ
jgi:hypothetical protein